jgi:hypothetical protein
MGKPRVSSGASSQRSSRATGRVSRRWILWSSVALVVSTALPLGAASRIDHEAQCTYKQLTWDDFRGPIVDGQQVAWLSATIVLDPVRVEMADQDGGGVIARARNPGVYALMNKLDSGAQHGGRTEENLAHEQIHFDLTEYLARRLSRELRELTVEGPTLSEELQRKLLLAVEERYNQTLTDLERLQQQYDGETSHGRRAGAQRKWARQAASLLASEKPYELK